MQDHQDCCDEEPEDHGEASVRLEPDGDLAPSADDQELDLGAAIWRGLLNEAIRSGTLHLDDPDSIRDFTGDVMEQLANGEVEFHWKIAHDATLRKEAFALHERGEFHLSTVLYATAVEHWLNEMLQAAGDRAELTQRDISQMIRDANLAAKVGWLWRVLHGSDFPSELRSGILELARVRNEFVHYKWTRHQVDDPTQQARNQQVRAASLAAPSLLEALDALEDSLLYGGNRALIEGYFPTRSGESARRES